MAGLSSTASICSAPKWIDAAISLPPAAPMISTRSGGFAESGERDRPVVGVEPVERRRVAVPGQIAEPQMPSWYSTVLSGNAAASTRNNALHSEAWVSTSGRTPLLSSVRMDGAASGTMTTTPSSAAATRPTASAALWVEPVRRIPTTTRMIATPAMIETGPIVATRGTTTRHASAAPARSEKYSRLMSSERRANSADTHIPIGRKLMYSPRQISSSCPTATSWIVVSPVQIARVSSGVTATVTYPTTTPAAAARVHAASSVRVGSCRKRPDTAMITAPEPSPSSARPITRYV